MFSMKAYYINHYINLSITHNVQYSVHVVLITVSRSDEGCHVSNQCNSIYGHISYVNMFTLV